LASLILVVNVVGELQRKRTLAASRGFLAAARLSCSMIHLSDRRTDGRSRRDRRSTGDSIYSALSICCRALNKKRSCR